jgi:hypothetical protein
MANTPDRRRLLPLGAMASQLGIQAKDLRQAAEAGTIPCVRVGERGLMFDPVIVEQALLDQASSRSREEVHDAL